MLTASLLYALIVVVQCCWLPTIIPIVSLLLFGFCRVATTTTTTQTKPLHPFSPTVAIVAKISDIKVCRHLSFNRYYCYIREEAKRYVATRLRLRQLNLSNMAKERAKLRVFLALMMICKVAVFLESLGGIIAIAVGTSGFSINQSIPDFHFAACVIGGAIVLGLLIFDFFCLRKSKLSQWLALSEIILSSLVLLLLLPSSTLAVSLFNCINNNNSSADDRQLSLLNDEQRALYTKQYCYSTGIAGVLGLLNAWWLFINIALASFAYKTSWEAFLQQRLQAGTPVSAATAANGGDDTTVGEPLNRRAPKVVMGEDAVAMR